MDLGEHNYWEIMKGEDWYCIYVISSELSEGHCMYEKFVLIIVSIWMPLLKEEALARPVNVFINLFRDEKAIKDNIRISSNHISILDDEG